MDAIATLDATLLRWLIGTFRTPWLDQPMVWISALATWGEEFAESDLSLVDNECGHGVSVVYHCPRCERPAPGSRVRMVGAPQR